MFTPQQIDQIAFNRVTFGGYDMQQVDDFLEPLTEDYVTLYKENALLKSKMRVLVGKLEEYRKSEATMKDAMVNAQKTCDKMVREAEAKCARMLSEASATASAKLNHSDAILAAEDSRVEEARKAAAAKIDEIEAQMRSCIQALERIKAANAPAAPVAPVAPAAPVADVSAPLEHSAENPVPVAEESADDVVDAISQSLEALVGKTEEAHPKAEPKHPINDSTTGKFANLNLQFGRNYDPYHK